MSLTPYAAAKVVNAQLEESGVDKQIPPQMMYNYTSARIRKGQKPLIECEKDGKINETAFAEWLERYINKQVALQKANEVVESK